MPQDQRRPNQSQSNNQENEKPQAASSSNHQSDQSSKEDEDFVDIDPADVEMQDAENTKPSIDSLDLHNFNTNVQEPEEDDDSDDEHDQMASHPLLSMLTGRLGQRRRGSTHKWDALHPVTQVLSVANVEDCTTLEEAAFPEHERCSREKVGCLCYSFYSLRDSSFKLKPKWMVTCSWNGLSLCLMETNLCHSSNIACRGALN